LHPASAKPHFDDASIGGGAGEGEETPLPWSLRRRSARFSGGIEYLVQQGGKMLVLISFACIRIRSLKRTGAGL
jgi:hypothetical protein